MKLFARRGISSWFCPCLPDTDSVFSPVSAAFDVTKKASAVCINEGVLFYVGGIINTIADALVTVLPIPLIMRLKMPKHERIGVVVLLSLGFFVTIAGIVRTYYIWLAQVHTQDETWWSYPLFVAASVEVDVGIVSNRTKVKEIKLTSH